MSAVRDRLRVGFGSVTLTLLACGGLGITALEVVHSDLRKSVHQATEVTGRLSRVRDATLRFVGSLPRGGGIVFDYMVPRESLGLMERMALDALARPARPRSW